MSTPNAGSETAGETLPGRFGKLFRTTAFKLSLAYLVLFALFAAAALGYVAWNARQVLDEQITSTIDAEINGLSEQYAVGGLRKLIALVEERVKQRGASLYLVTTPVGEHIVGNVGELPASVLTRNGQTEATYGYGREDGQAARRAIFRTFTVANGFKLVVGRDTEERERLRAAIGNTFGTALGLMILVGGIVGWFVSSRVLKRIDDMTQTTRGIMAGDLGGRLRLAGTGDEFDRLASNLNRMLDRIGELMRGMKEVSDNIAHDLKTPLTRLRNRAEEAMSADGSPEAMRAALGGIIEESEGLIRVFNGLLTIARLEAGSAEKDFTAFDAGVVVREVGELYEALAEESGLALAIATETGLMMNGNRELIGQALANLLDNAIKYGSDGSGPKRIVLGAQREADRIRLTVADHGPGIPDAERAHVLDRFVRLEAARSRPGYGLGLSLVAAVARQHGGTLALTDNAPGLAVEMSLPAAASHEPMQA